MRTKNGCDKSQDSKQTQVYEKINKMKKLKHTQNYSA